MNLNQKNIHEKYCGDCGKIINLKAEIHPQCGYLELVTTSCERNNLG